MSNTTVTIARLRMPAFGMAALCGAWTTTEHTAVVSAYQPLSDSRNAAKGGARAWSPPV